MDILQAIILGIVQGLTEFLPVSSSGHLIIAKELLGIETSSNIAFEIVVHAATVLSTITVLWKYIFELLRKFFKFEWNPETQYICKLLISMIPIMIVGFFFKDQVEALFGEGILLVGCMLLVTALLLSLTHFIQYKQRKDVGWGSAFVIGISQAIAVLPGLSRSGTTISTGLLLGVKKEEVAQFSFLMVLIPILGEMFLGLVGGEFSASMSGIPTASLAAGFVTAYLAGLFACKVMIELVKRVSLLWFAGYCLIVGIIAIIGGLC
ncbi:undecaprenyl-diphosphate phosphatase [Bacteroidales bacterium OttesenSCG-928-C03]|nr:undecaprenyl-diphosphate phosphatase [Bacteroidales bacterium OttesenSCG-928-C03]MDL2326706.1 undecaprenyl-diphosphate phosphatase [Bacteroidales bacterium OttesenSCG-928-A14]